MNFWHFVRVMKTRKWVIIGIVVVTLLVVAIGAPSPEVVYEASAYMSPTPQVMQNGATSTSGSSAPASPTDREVTLSNLIILAQGGDVYERALDFLALPEEEQQRLAPGLRIYKQVPRVEIEPGKLLSYADWADVIEVAPVRIRTIGEGGTTTDIIRIKVSMPNKEAVPYVANAVGHAFAEAYRDKSREDSRTYARFLETSKMEAKARLHELQMKIAERKRGHKVVSVDAETQAAIASFAELESERSKADAAVREAEATLADLDAQLVREPVVTRQSMPVDLSPAVAKLKAELTDAEAELRALGRRYKPTHEAFKAAQARIADIKKSIAKEGATFAAYTVNDVRKDLEKRRSEASSALDAARGRLRSLTSSSAAAQSRIDSLGQLEPGLAELLRDYALAEKSYNTLSERHAQVLMAAQESTRTGSIVSSGWAREALGPYYRTPALPTLLIWGFVLSLVVGIMAAVWLDAIDNRMRNAADVERLLELPVVGLTPELNSRNGTLTRLTHLYPLSPMAESYKILRAKVLLARQANPFNTLMVATGRPGQGATTTICNLAIALAQTGLRVILIDADMRRPSLHKFFNTSNDAGLSTLLQGDGNLTDAFQETEVENLIVVPAGPQTMNPSELLGSNRMREVVEKLEGHCDLVLFDAPSTVVFSDALVLASWVEAVLMVVSANQVPRGTEVETRDLLRQANANVIGVVVNRMSPDKVDSCYFYSHYYSDSAKLPDGSLPGNGDDARGRADQSAQPAPVLMAGTKHGRRDEEPEPTDDEHEESPFPE